MICRIYLFGLEIILGLTYVYVCVQGSGLSQLECGIIESVLDKDNPCYDLE